MTQIRGIWRAAIVLLVAALGMLGIPSTADAHGVLRHSRPASGARLTTAPRELRLTFNEAVELAVARLALLGPDSAAVALSPLRRGDSAAVLVADITGPLTAGTHTVEWQVVGRDGHPVRGRFQFTIAPGAAGLEVAVATDPGRPDSLLAGDAPPAADPEGLHDPAAAPADEGFDAGSPLFVAVRWLGFAAMLGLVGTLGFGLLVLPAAARRDRLPAEVREGAGRGLRAVGIAAAAVLLVAAGLRLVAQSAAMREGPGALEPGLVWAMMGQTLWGTAWLLQGTAALMAMAAFALLPRRRAIGWTLGVIAAVAAAVAASLSGHAAAVPTRAALAVAADAVHVLAAGGWLGTLLVLTVVGLPAALRAAPGERGPAAAALVNAFSPLALACAAAVALTGALSAWTHLGSLGALTTTGYGRTLLIKLLLVSLLAATGAYNWRRVRPVVAEERGVGRLRHSARLELAVGVVVLVVTAVLVATPTPLDIAH